MALANVAFLAAMNNMRVLIMDWDLEAPGLHHYFRGLLEPDEMAKLRSARGVLDLAWEWRNSIDKASDAGEVDRQFERFRGGEPFLSVVQSIMSDGIDDRGVLDIIPAGGDFVDTPEPVEYERALAAMSWTELLDRYAGGALIDALRQWASTNYDLVLVDSRTGLADVAGICTMQLPDAVVLSFVLNRQNIEGVARIASAIRRNRGEDLKLWPVPMRVSREGTDEEADATARALRELTRPGRLDKDATERDLKRLLIKAEPNVPFMESLSAFNETNAALDPLTANMARLASEITGRLIAIPEIPEQWRDLVSSRLAPTLSTDTYLRQLLTAEPNRAGRALHGYLISAISALVEGDELADDYVSALAETSISFEQRGDRELDDERYDISGRVVALLRKMHEREPDTWRPLLISALEGALDSDLSWLDPDDEAVALEEIDDLLEAEEQNVAIITRRVELRIRAARLYDATDQPLQQLGAADEALSLIKIVRKTPTAQQSEWTPRRIEAQLQRASALEALDQPEDAAETLRKAIRLAAELDDGESGSDGQRLGFDANYRLMRLLRQSSGDLEEASKLALEASRLGSPNSPVFIARFSELAEAVMAIEPNAESSAEILRRGLQPVASSRPYAHFFNRAPAGAARFTQALGDVFRASAPDLPPDQFLILGRLAIDAARAVTIASTERALAISHRRTTSVRYLQIVPTQIEALRSFISSIRDSQHGAEFSAALHELELLADGLSQRAREELPARSGRISRKDL